MSIVDVAASGIDEILGREWLVTNQLGGYASSTASGLNTRKYHGLLVASMAPPVRRMVLLSCVDESVIVGDQSVPVSLGCCEYPGTINPAGHEHLRGFSSDPFPRWVYQTDSFTIEKTLRLMRGENTVVLTYTLLGGARDAVRLELRPQFALRGIHELTFQWNGKLEAENHGEQQHRIPPTCRTPEFFFAHDGAFEAGGCWYRSTIHRCEAERGYAGLEDLWMPGVVSWSLEPGKAVSFVCSTEPIQLGKVRETLDRSAAANSSAIADSDDALQSLLAAADSFLVQPKTPASINVVTQFPWSAPSGRDALIAMTGLMLVPRRFEHARALLDVMSDQLRDGLMPSEFPENGSAALYDGADVSLWFIDSVNDYLTYTHDESTVRDRWFDAIIRIIRSYQNGEQTLGISIDAEGLISSHAPGRATSWMDAKVSDWVVTPRHGRPVELNALWYNALRIASRLSEKFGRQTWTNEFSMLADSVYRAFNRRFWNEMARCCFDVVTDRGADPSIRPNQLLAISLTYPVLAPERYGAVLDAVHSRLLTPFGVRTLAPDDPAYHSHYRGDIVSRDRAYHQGSAFPWLLGPLVKAMARTYRTDAKSRAEARDVLQPCITHLQTGGMGTLGELFDAESPNWPGGAIASAKSVGMILQAYVEDVLGKLPSAAAFDVATPPSTKPPVRA